MFTTRFTTIAATVIATGALSIGAFATAATASALTNSADEAFLTNIGADGISFTSAKEAVGDANYVCDSLAHGETGASIGSEILSNTDLSTRQAAAFLVDSVNAYCPKYSGRLTA